MKHNQLKEGVLTDFKAGNLKGDLYKREPLFNATALYYTLLADIIQATFLRSLNQEAESFLVSVKDLVSASVPILTHNKTFKVMDYKDKIISLRTRLKNLGNTGNAEYEKEKIFDELMDIRENILRLLSPVLMATKRTLNPEGKISDAFGII